MLQSVGVVFLWSFILPNLAVYANANFFLVVVYDDGGANCTNREGRACIVNEGIARPFAMVTSEYIRE